MSFSVGELLFLGGAEVGPKNVLAGKTSNSKLRSHFDQRGLSGRWIGCWQVRDAVASLSRAEHADPMLALLVCRLTASRAAGTANLTLTLSISIPQGLPSSEPSVETWSQVNTRTSGARGSQGPL